MLLWLTSMQLRSSCTTSAVGPSHQAWPRSSSRKVQGRLVSLWQVSSAQQACIRGHTGVGGVCPLSPLFKRGNGVLYATKATQGAGTPCDRITSTALQLALLESAQCVTGDSGLPTAGNGLQALLMAWPAPGGHAGTTSLGTAGLTTPSSPLQQTG